MQARALTWLARAGIFLLPFSVAAAPRPTPPPNAELKDITPPVPLSFMESMETTDWLLLGGAAVLLVLAGVAGWYFFLRKEPAPPALPPDPRVVARTRLAALRERIGTLEPRLFGVEASDVLRQFIRARFGVSTLRRTSEEFLNAMMKDRVFSPREVELLGKFLSQCDLLKFARAEASEHEAGKLVDEALSFVEGAASPAVVTPAVIRPEVLAR